MKRVCYVIPSLDVGGTETQLVQLAKRLTADFEVSILCTRDEGGLAGEVRRAGIYLRVLHGWRALGAWDPFTARRLERAFRRHRPDVLHSYLFGFDYAANRAARRTGVPVVLSSRRQLATWKQKRHLRLQRKANELVDRVVANSQAVADHAAHQEGLDPTRFTVIRNGIDPAIFTGAADPATVRARFKLPVEGPLVGMVANFSPVKDHALFIATAAEIRKARPDAHFLLVGRGRLRGQVEAAVARHGLEEAVTMVSTIAEVPDLFSAMDVHLLCSRVEGFPNVLLEAMASGTPVAAPAVGGIPEIVRDGETGLLVPERNPVRMAEAALRLLDDAELAQHIRKQARAFVCAEHSFEMVAAAHRRLYDELLAKSVSSGR